MRMGHRDHFQADKIKILDDRFRKKKWWFRPGSASGKGSTGGQLV